MKSLLVSIALFASISSQAALLTFEQGSLQLDGVNLNTTAAVNGENGQPGSLKMDLLGAGLRQKTVFIAKVKVYVAQMFSNNKGAFTRDANALTSLTSNSTSVAMKLTLKRNLDAQTLATSFKEAISTNGYAIEGEVANLLSLIQTSADAGEGQSVTMLMQKTADGHTNIYYEDAKGTVKSFVGSSELMTKVMSIWLGRSADDGLAALKTQLLKPVY